jgi:hypothetical protein
MRGYALPLLVLLGCQSADLCLVMAPTLGAPRANESARTAHGTPPPAPSPDTPAAPDLSIVGHWVESMPRRMSCNDEVEVASEQGLRISSRSCKDGRHYAIEEPTFKRGVLRFELRVVPTGRVVHYRLVARDDGTLRGVATSRLPHATIPAVVEVTWSRGPRGRPAKG